MRDDRPSGTALIVAAGVLRRFRIRASRHLVAEEAARIAEAALLSAGIRGRALRWLAGPPIGTLVCRLLERLLLPGITLHYAVRKRAIEEAAREALAGGVSRVVVLGAGLDALGARLSGEGFDVVEIDHPATQALKRKALRRAGVPHSIRFIPADLSREFPEGVLAAGPCVVIAEGLLMYLEPGRLRELVRGPARSLPAGSRLILTFIERHGEEPLGFRNASRLVTWWLRQRGEPFRWGVYPTRLKGLLKASRLETLELIDHRELRDRYLKRTRYASAPLAIGEFIAVAARIPAGAAHAIAEAAAPTTPPMRL